MMPNTNPSALFLRAAILAGALAGPALAGAPYPPSPVITDLTWAGKSTISRMASGSDTFPITWADDGHLYTAWADGHGFEPKVRTKLSLGFARVEGDPLNHKGFNIRSPDEQRGGGSKGRKGSGMLMVDGVLYMWVRNDNKRGAHCRLWWSTDHARNWTQAGWNFKEFGYCTFINFGRNYAGARDDYVYSVSHDHPSAYSPADRFILMRVPRGSIKTRSAYEFFKGLDGNGNPLWTTNISQRGPVFQNAGRCARSGISYNAALGRYLWWQQVPSKGIDTRARGGFGVYDAPEPWGPWTTAYYTSRWDVGPGETGSFPPKWMSVDGKTMYLVFSGNDRFSVRKVTISVKGRRP